MKRKCVQPLTKPVKNTKKQATQSTLLPFLGLFDVGSVIATDQTEGGDDFVVVSTSTPTAIFGATYAIPIQDLPPGWRDAYWHTRLSIEPKTNDCSQGPPKLLVTPFEEHGMLHLPRFEGRRLFGTCPDVRSRGVPIGENLGFSGKLCDTTPPQVEATQAVLNELALYGGAMLVLPCGFGKTVCALWLAWKLGRRALVVVNSTNLLRQWKKRIAQFLPEARIGIIQQKTVEVENTDIVIGMLQSLSKKEYDPDLLATIGTVIVDEAHHIAAPMFSKAMRKLPSRNVIGLSATPDRPDGCSAALYWFMGMEAYRAMRVWERVNIRMIQYTHGCEEELTYRNKQVKYPEMVNRMVDDPVREKLVCYYVSKYYEMGRHVLVMCDRRDQVTDIAHLVSMAHPELEVGVVLGGMKEGVSEPALGRQVIVSTYHYFSEGTDVPRLDTLIFATPRGNVEQSLGRILRPHPDKATPLVVDICDIFSLFSGMMWKRHRYYRSEDYGVERLTDTEDGFVPQQTSFFVDQPPPQPTPAALTLPFFSAGDAPSAPSAPAMESASFW